MSTLSRQAANNADRALAEANGLNAIFANLDIVPSRLCHLVYSIVSLEGQPRTSVSQWHMHRDFESMCMPALWNTPACVSPIVAFCTLVSVN